jgi:hypothetical protein
MNSPTLIKSYTAGAACRARRIATIGAADLQVVEAGAAAIVCLGVFDSLDAATGDFTDVIHLGTSEVLLGGPVTRGARLTSDASGAAITAAPAAGTNIGVVAFALASGVAGDIIPAFIQPHVLQG